MPFLVDSLTMELTRAAARRARGHPPAVRRGPRHHRRAPGGAPGRRRLGEPARRRRRVRESWMHVEIDRIPERRGRRRDRGSAPAGAARRPRGGRGLGEDARPGARRSSTSSTSRPAAAAEPTRSRRAATLLQLAGRRPLHLPRLPRVPPRAARATTSVLRARPRHRARHPARRPGHVGVVRQAARRWSRRKAREKTLLVLAKANSRATVHRPAYLDYVGVKTFDENGEVVGERRFLGLFSSAAYTESLTRIPLLREKAAEVLRPDRLRPAQPRRQGADGHPRDLPARRAVPHPGRRAGADRRGGDAHPRAPPAAAVHPPRHLRPLRLRAWSTCPATATTPASASGSPAILQGRGSAASPSSSPCGSASPTTARRALRGPPAQGRADRARSTSPTSSAGSPRPPARGATTSPPPCIARVRRGGRRRGWPGSYVDSFPEAYKEDFVAAHRRRSTSAGSRRSSRRDGRASTCRSTSELDAGRGEARLKVFRIGPPLSLSRDAADAVLDGRRGRRRAALRARGPATRPTYIYEFGLRYGRALPGRRPASCSRTRCARCGTATTRSTASTRWCSAPG